MTSYELSRSFWDYSFENPEKIRPIHSAIFFFAIEHCNRLGWKEKFGLPSQMVMEAVGVKNWRTYSKALNDLVEFGFIKMIEISKNQYSSNIIALVENTKAPTKALDKALSKHSTKHSQSTVSIDKQYNNITKEQYNKKEFFEDWNSKRLEHLKLPSNLKSFSYDSEQNLKDLLKDYEPQDIRNALIGLFKQKKLPGDNTSMQSNPDHFLKYFNSYLTAYGDQNVGLYGKKETAQL